MIARAKYNTDHEELHQQVHRTQGEAWGECVALERTMPLRQPTGNVTIRPRMQPPADDTVVSRKSFLGGLLDAAESSNVQISEVLRQSFETLRTASRMWSHLTSIKRAVSPELLQGFTEASGITSLRGSFRTFFERPDKLDWNDAKNDRRCDLIDKEIEGTLLPTETCELAELQRQMLAYRRKVAPLPLKEAQELHQQLLRRAAEQIG